MTARLDLGLLEQEPWIREGACVGADPSIFFPQGPRLLDFGPAYAICSGCPVRFECLAYALRLHMDDGMWGGKTPRERKQIRRKRACARGERGRA